jgi:hypothetical protein
MGVEGQPWIEAGCGFSEEEQSIVAYLERVNGRPLTPQEIFTALEQAAQLGEIDRPTRH